MEKKLTQQEKDDGEMRNIIEEARVILPGVQALFGFQTIAVFNERFSDLETYAKVCHLLGLAMVVVTVAMIMTPAVYYRACGGNASERMARVSSFMIRGGLAPLALGIALDMFTVFFVATSHLAVSVSASAATLLLFVILWCLVPNAGQRHIQARRSE
jgi:uncharacterized membrane protein YidH (DUF202 family)